MSTISELGAFLARETATAAEVVASTTDLNPAPAKTVRSPLPTKKVESS
jgi:hypothetical protein